MMDMETARAELKGVRIVTKVDPDVPSVVEADTERVRQVLSNLVGNAVKFTARGEVVLSAQIAECRTDGSVAVRFSVRDTGIGIPLDRLNELFKPFSQVDSSTTRRFGGTGLGLSIVKRLSELRGGDGGVNRPPGGGSGRGGRGLGE